MTPPSLHGAHARALVFEAPYRLAVHEVELPGIASGEARIRTLCSAISAGTEMLFYRGQAPAGMALDANLAALPGIIEYPLRYGYACVGQVEEVGPGDDPSWVGRCVFAFHPHASAFVAPLHSLLPVPSDMTPECAALFPSVETAVTLVHDAAPTLGERVAVFGQGVVGLMVTSLLARFPLADLVAVDPAPLRQAHALRRGAHRAIAPFEATALHDLDLVLELSGNPAVLDAAIRAAGFDGRIVVGSWYGARRAPVDLGGHFHRNRIRITASQVSTFAPALTGRWDRVRRTELVWRLLRDLDAGSLVTHRFALEDAAMAFELIDRRDDSVLQTLLSYA